MIKITNGEIERVVTKGAFENIYKSLGYEEMSDKAPAKEVAAENNIFEDAKESKDDEKLSKADNRSRK